MKDDTYQLLSEGNTNNNCRKTFLNKCFFVVLIMIVSWSFFGNIVFLSRTFHCSHYTTPNTEYTASYDCNEKKESNFGKDADNTILVITPTYRRPERLADLTMLSQTLMHIQNIFWILIEDGNISDKVNGLIDRTGLNHVYLNTTNQGLPCRGWAHRNFAFDWIRENRARFSDKDVIFFADDDNGYDIRLFTEYLPKVTKIGVWGVGLSAGAIVESPKVDNGTVIGWNVGFRPDRTYATDMAGFGVNIDLLLNSNASFNLHCAGTVPEECFLKQLNVPVAELEPFGWDGKDADIYVWHRKTQQFKIEKELEHHYYVEKRQPITPHCKRMMKINNIGYEKALKYYARRNEA